MLFQWAFFTYSWASVVKFHWPKLLYLKYLQKFHCEGKYLKSISTNQLQTVSAIMRE